MPICRTHGGDERYLTEIAEEVRALGVAMEIALLHGDPVKELAAFVVSHHLDLLVMGPHGHRMLGDLLLGQTVDPLRHRVTNPVLVARQPSGLAPPDPGSPGRDDRGLHRHGVYFTISIDRVSTRAGVCRR